MDALPPNKALNRTGKQQVESVLVVSWHQPSLARRVTGGAVYPPVNADPLGGGRGAASTMENPAFLLTIALLLGCSVFLLRSQSREGLGFGLCCSLYVVFVAGCFLAAPTVVIFTWLALAMGNMAIQYRALRSQRTAEVAPAVLLASLVIWPIQFAALRISENDQDALSRSRKRQRQRIGMLPATIAGTVSFTHHIGSEDAQDMVWLEEYEDLELFVTSDLYDAIGIEEGRTVSLAVEEREQSESNGDHKALWIIDGTVLS